ncbi:acetoin dehydrogenase dihydrolipoyllysine-residue acetyltransferase subunit [Ponticoccus sp. SC2-23]|uniref:acetoin dehydrogenase dihydrolipoyllysine-residue acetyltransferase subunit n=1 Tax=Alexandriicola marinus TaxID=2081710 RepID=UPI000FD99207|nr:acetoin dehydrogenase dihydrolipoyllysine-residue acetyltransferase subunit [Alexandriicola marinus]MBM1221355.1 acetoin dehydrogenase dihydrolipoyllysine-residue acetyltransferase subunit [Ponticoccus sp. SC6-9]MBM1226396.1 acetoin dehydrogenase dihydrolipoyllysine-residue acetyltransferase subunit [Ponticoccus sp. SC6-15]MBM1230347.1 acetoin dehydrogenase dihydrolipoyllysine-residue acetyltransferase subunit [Ponticoccus sp. SC6-38]MBM1234870.1 acetoin dehydrogenase dihydrolipoyllysine-res
MPVEVIMPKVDMDMATGKIMSWHVGEGEAVTKGAPLFDIETDKAAMEVEAPDNGILHHTAPEGTEVPIGQAVAWLYAEGEAVGEQPAPFAAAKTPEPAPSDEPVVADISHPEPDVSALPQFAPAPIAADRARATPKARAMARKSGLDINALHGSGPLGRIQAEDVLSALQTVPAMVAAPGFSAENGPLSVTRSRGGTGTPVVLIHGFASDAQSWAPLEAHLKHRPLVRIELPGHGKSPKLRIADFAALSRTLRQCFDSLGLENAHLVGHSLGGALSLALADTRPRSVASLTLIAPAGLGPEINGAALSGLLKATRAESLGPWLKALVADETLITDAYVRLAMSGRSEPNLRHAQSALADVLFPDGVQAFDLRAALDRIERPTRIIWGKQDGIIPWKHAFGAPGHVALHLFKGIGHMPQIECADAVGSILKSAV